MFKALAILYGLSPAHADSIFSDKIRYFGSDSRSAKERQATPAKKFDWQKQLDIENDQFFKEGDYTPPAPFMEALRRPTKENILLFEKWQATRNLLLSRYETERAKYVADGRVPVPSSQERIDYEALGKYHFTFYFDATCSACNAMFLTVNAMAEHGLVIVARRLDRGEQAVSGLIVPWEPASQEEIKTIGMDAVPVVVAFEDSTRKAFKLVGNKSVVEISKALKTR